LGDAELKDGDPDLESKYLTILTTHLLNYGLIFKFLAASN